MGRDSKEKRISTAISATRILARSGLDVTLYLAGVSEDSREIRKFPDAPVVALGWLSREEIQNHLSDSWALLVPSEYEGLPLNVLEAMSCGLPVISSNSCEGIFSDSGIIINSQNPELWASEIEKLLEDRNSWINMANHGPNESKKFDPEIIRREWGRVYNKASKERGV